jgi:MmeI, DNA-methyltransferase domain/MmeI, N-terminal domain/MmeI, helicase spacer domain/MmeI, target recognition domain
MHDEKVEIFIKRWSASSAAERANKDQFFLELCAVLGVDAPDPDREKHQDYCFEKSVVIAHEDGRSTTQFIDFYKKDCFVIEAKQGSESGDATVGTARRGTATWDKAMRGAFGQALKYASYLPEGKPPFLITCDIGHVFEIWTGFSGDYGGYGARRTIELAHLNDPEIFDYFVKIFTDPWDLDPARHAQRVTREVAAKLAELAKTLEADEHNPELVAQFLMRSIFTMFCEDVGLLPENLFTNAVREHWIPNPRLFQSGVEQLWKAMRDGLPFGFVGKLLRFNGGLFSTWQSLPMTEAQLELLLEAAKMDWASVEPAIFGTLVERALNPVERRKLGAHFTPREYIERLVKPTVIEPLRAEWEIAQAQARQIVDKGDAEPTKADLKKAADVIRRFHSHLVQTRVLDPACGSGNFLYVTLDLFKEIEAEILRELADLGQAQTLMELEGVTVNPGQFLGIEINPRAREIADLVLWIGYLQWRRRTHGDRTPPEPVLQPYKNIVCRDAVLDYDDIKPRTGKDGKSITVWDMRTFKTSPITGKEVPDENARLPVLDYVNPRPAQWPEADYVVSNPPFVGNKIMRKALGDGYVESLKNTFPKFSGTADFVLFWWDKAAHLIREGKLKRFGFITTNSITQAFNRSVLEPHLTAKKNQVAVAWAIPDHPWVDSGADVRIAMTIGTSSVEISLRPVLGHLVFEEKEKHKESHSRRVELTYNTVQQINADLTGGANVASALRLNANKGLSFMGMTLIGKGFRVTPDEVTKLGYDLENLPPVIRSHMNARELMQKWAEHYVLDLFGLNVKETQDKYPPLYQWLLERVKPERDQNKDSGPKKYWWLFGRSRPDLRTAVADLGQFIITPETSKHRVFVISDLKLVPDHSLFAVALEDIYFLGILSSQYQSLWTEAAGSRMATSHAPRWRNTICFDPFPFPDATDEQKACIRDLGERLDAHRKKVQAEHAKATLTAMYNALERLREIERTQKAGEEAAPLTEKEREFHDSALIGILKQIHDNLDAAVADAYGWPVDLPDEEILERLVALNHERSAEEKKGVIRWLRPEFQDPEGKSRIQPAFEGMDQADIPPSATHAPHTQISWPKTVPDQLRAIRDLLASKPGAWTVDDVAAAFKRAHKGTIRRHLESMEALGILVSTDADDKQRTWSQII